MICYLNFVLLGKVKNCSTKLGDESVITYRRNYSTVIRKEESHYEYCSLSNCLPVAEVVFVGNTPFSSTQETVIPVHDVMIQ